MCHQAQRLYAGSIDPQRKEPEGLCTCKGGALVAKPLLWPPRTLTKAMVTWGWVQIDAWLACHPDCGILSRVLGKGPGIDSGCSSWPLKAQEKLKAASFEAGRFGGEVGGKAPFSHVIPTEAKQLPSTPWKPRSVSLAPGWDNTCQKGWHRCPLHFCRVFRSQHPGGGGLASWRPVLSLGSRMFIPVSWL